MTHQQELQTQFDAEVVVPAQWPGRASQAAPPPLPRSVPRPVPVPVPAQPGHRFLIYKQDPSVAELGSRLTYIPTVVLNGPMDVRVQTELQGVTPIARNISGDFVFTAGTPEFDCAHTFAVVRETMAMYERHNGGVPIPFAWNVGGNTERVTVFPHAAEGANAFYSRTAKALKFLFFTPKGQPASNVLFTCQSFDIVAHETGHAILDGLKPGWLSADAPPQTGGLHEAFGDITAIFLALAQPDQAEALVALTKANLHDRSFLAEMAEQFGKALGMPSGLRNADNDLKLSEVGNEVHSISQVFTGAIYDILADVYTFELSRQQRTKDATVVLIETASALCRLVFDAIVASPATDARYVDVANKMLQASADRGDPAVYRTFIRNRFAVREVTTAATPLRDLMTGQMAMTEAAYTGDGQDVTEVEPHDENSASLLAAQDRSRCCGTMQMPEYQAVPAEKLAQGGSLEDDDILRSQLDELRSTFSK
ncbi:MULTISPECIES: hypothetical protein [Actinomadura]|jgi:hypothetical protein|uniref:Peptidase M4 C-terminal domain-containing protein n=1 Tax=Actinomadura citrea TaxID=46158 RepID=A0A7Y9KIX9_9ACTN|nr:hypothetical protein [Actinomadura citrea]NYE17199.1 hypothetical protein [Actinomadura citrea]GGT92357.1 hypothetical protein GCM10010177_59520 [Actinomadura citrea]